MLAGADNNNTLKYRYSPSQRFQQYNRRHHFKKGTDSFDLRINVCDQDKVADYRVRRREIMP